MLLRDPYQFKLLQLHQDPRIVNHVNNYIVTEYGYMRESQLLRVKNFETATGTLKPVILYGTTSAEKDIPAFHHPLVNEKNNWIALDLRAFVRPSVLGGPLEPRNASDYAMAVSRFVLTGMWLSDKQGAMYGLRLAHVSFAEWLSTNLSRKFGLGMAEQVKLFALASLYYANLFTNHFSADDVVKLKLRMKNEIFVESIIDEVAASAGNLDNIEEFCAACYRVTQSPRLQGLNLGVLVNVLSNNWFSTQGNELPLLALEHPPTWISMVSACVTTKSYRNSYISKVVEGKNKKGAAEEFNKALNAIVYAQLET